MSNGMKALKSLPDFGKTVIKLADEVKKIIVSLSELWKGVNQSSDPSFATVRKELKNQWETLHHYLRMFHSFGVDMVTLKEDIGGRSKEALMELLGDVKECANFLRQESEKLKENDMSKAFSKGIEPNTAASVQSRHNSLSTITIENENWKAFVFSLDPIQRESLNIIKDIDISLINITSHVRTMSKFWEDTYKGWDALIRESGDEEVTMMVEDANTIAQIWKGYQSSTEEVIVLQAPQFLSR
ncbi:hypothetical protein CPB86DRAFT_813313 [Serendipita vermifera]|nr:hypothetical protein CPB86DRAFT_813313 [Serendipita vermifera]